MLLSSLLQNTIYNEAIYSAWGNHGPSRTAMPSISRLQIMVTFTTFPTGCLKLISNVDPGGLESRI